MINNLTSVSDLQQLLGQLISGEGASSAGESFQDIVDGLMSGDLSALSDLTSNALGTAASDGEGTDITDLGGVTSASDLGSVIAQNMKNDLLVSEYANNMTTEEIISGSIDNLTTAMVDMVESDLTLQYTMQVRNKIVEAYQDIMRMQV